MALTQVKTLGIAADAVTGAKVADDQIDSEHYIAASIDNEHLANNAVDTDEIADDAVTLAKMDALARGKLIVGDASGNPSALAAGSDNYVLTMDANGDAGWEAASAGAALTGSTNNEVVTVTGANAMTGESGLTFDGTHLSITDGNLVIATAGHGIDFSAQTASSATGASMAAELLDHYEEGTWTPRHASNNEAPSGCTMTTAGGGYGHYKRVGSLVFISFNLYSFQIASGNTGQAKLIQLPFAPASSTAGAIALCIENRSTTFQYTQSVAGSITTTGIMFYYDGFNYNNWQTTANGHISGGGCYHIA